MTPRSPWSGLADDAELAHWQSVAERVASTLATDALDRDRANLDPHDEVQLLRDAGLVTLLDPASAGGGGAHWETAFRVVRILARADASIAQLLAYHYINESNIGFVVEPAEQDSWHRRTVRGRWLWGDSVNPVDPDLHLVPAGDDPADGWRLNGLKRFSTGSSVGDVLLVNAVVAGGERHGQTLTFLLEHGRAGVEYLGDWDFLGQRLSASGSVAYHDVRVMPADVLGVLRDEPFSTLVTPGIQLFFGELYLGIAQGALARGRELTLARKNAWFLSSAERYAEDPFVQRVYGELVARTAAVEALADRVAREFDRVVARGAELTAEERGELAIAIAQLKVVSSEIGVDVANRIFETTGSSSAKSSVGLDLFWRNVRTHSLHDPVDYKKLEVGAHYLTGVYQPISLYT
jgi:alkylation response protein AidB-like acyl-CoA dehydrogenase